jgi:hypothetical protein
MAFDKKALVRFAESFMGANDVKSLYFYATNDAAAVVAAAGYFNDARTRLSPGDVIICSLDVDGTRDTRNYTMNAVPSSGNVTTTLGTATAAA